MATKWGIASVGLISTDFVRALSTLPEDEHKVVAVAARDLSRAQAFALEHAVPNSYGSYEELANDPSVEVVYIGAINTEHFRLGKLFLNAGKHVLCEKPLCMNQNEARQLIAFAKEKNRFLMEAIWSRFNPVYAKIRDEIALNAIGEPLLVQADFGVKISDKDRVSKKELGGSAVLDIGVYTIQLATMIFGGAPKSIKAVGNTNTEGVDESALVVLDFSNGRGAVLTCHSKVSLPNQARILGSKGTIVIDNPFWCPLSATINGQRFAIEPEQASKPFRYQNSVLLRYEAIEVRRCLQSGLLESPILTLNESLILSQIEDEIRQQVGVQL